MSEAMEKAWTVWWGSLRASKEWQGLHMDAARAAFKMGWELRKTAEFEKTFGGDYEATCDACGVEAVIGTEEVPHPVDARLHTCRRPGYKCSVCGSTDVQHAMWVEVNTDVVHEDFGTWCHGDNSYCPKCSGEGRDPHPHLEEIK